MEKNKQMFLLKKSHNICLLLIKKCNFCYSSVRFRLDLWFWTGWYFVFSKQTEGSDSDGFCCDEHFNGADFSEKIK